MALSAMMVECERLLLFIYLFSIIFQVQDAILNLPNPYLRGTTVPLDTCSLNNT